MGDPGQNSSFVPKILIANGVNLDLLGRRQPRIYGSETLKDLETIVRADAPTLATTAGLGGADIHFFQTNSEERFLDEISKDWHGALLNPGAWTHTSLALGDRMAALEIPYVEVHISHLAKREEFRQKSFIAPHSLGSVSGLGLHSYLSALLGLFYKLSALNSATS